MAKRTYGSKEETIQAIIRDFERRIREGITPPKYFSRDRVFNMLSYGAWGSWHATWDEVNAWFDKNRPDVPTGREVEEKAPQMMTREQVKRWGVGACMVVDPGSYREQLLNWIAHELSCGFGVPYIVQALQMRSERVTPEHAADIQSILDVIMLEGDSGKY